MTFIEILKKRWYIIIAIMIIIILFLNWGDLSAIFGGESFSSVHLYEYNNTFCPEGTIRYTLTDEDFTEFPQLAPVIRDGRQNPLQIRPDGSRLFLIPLTASEMAGFNARYWSNSSGGETVRTFVYRGACYSYDVPQIH